MDWRDAGAYAYGGELSREQWAWEFLRRNPAYRADYAAFSAIWHALEAEYGTPPNRDFARWKQDPRAYGPLPDATMESIAGASGELCTVDDERVLLECWMGAKWGFYKFPLDPQRTDPPRPEELGWRPPPPPTPRTADDPYRLDVSFDLARPLPPQLEAAKLRLVSPPPNCAVPVTLHRCASPTSTRAGHAGCVCSTPTRRGPQRANG